MKRPLGASIRFSKRHGTACACVALAALLMPFSLTMGSPPDETGASASDRPRINVLLVTVDTLRADHLSCYGYCHDTSPTIDALAAGGVRFKDATVQWPKTWPSMASMLTGTYPNTNGIRMKPRRPLPQTNVTLAEMLAELGYRTAAVVSNANLGRNFAFDQGFEHFVEVWLDRFRAETGEDDFHNAPGKVKQYTDATFVTDSALSWLQRLPADAPFMLWVHYMEPHGPYVPPDKYALMFHGEYPAQQLTVRDIPTYQLQYDGITGELITNQGFYVAQYDREIRYLDDEIKRLLEGLEAHGTRERTLVIFTADHGESLGEHDYYFEHGRVPYQTTGHVPWILSLPGRLPKGLVLDMPVGLIDLVPTVMDILGRPRPGTAEGASLLPVIEGKQSDAPPYVYMEAGRFEPAQLVVRHGPWKLVHFRHEEDRKLHGHDEFVLFNLQQDPAELNDLAAELPDVVARLRRALEGFGKGAVTAGKPAGDEIKLDGLDEDTQRMLKSLGYLE